MIKNDRQFRIIKARVDRLLKLAEEVEGRLQSGAADERRSELELRTVRSEIQRMSLELEEYEALRTGRSEVGTAGSVEDLPRLLIRARIAAGLTQAALAQRLGLKEQQVQRYESTDYEGASLTRLSEVARALNVTLFSENGSPDLPSLRWLLKRLEAVGLDRKLVARRIAPPTLRAGGEDPASVLTLAGRLGRIFGWNFDELLSDAPGPKLRPAATAAFKLPKGRNAQYLNAYAAYAHYLATLALKAAVDLRSTRIPDDPTVFRDLILKHGGLTLESAIAAAWDLGVPVLPLADVGAFHAAYWRHGGRGVIVLKQRHRNAALWFFDFLHEMKHAADKPDLMEREVIDVPPDAPERLESAEESAANEFAGEVLLGSRPERLFDLVWEKSSGKPGMMKQTAKLVARKESVDMGALAYYVAHKLKDRGVDWWGAATNLQPETDDPWKVCRDAFLARTELSHLEPMDRELLIQALTEDEPTAAQLAGQGANEEQR